MLGNLKNKLVAVLVGVQGIENGWELITLKLD